MKKSAGVPEFCRYWKVVVMQRTSSNGSQVGWVGWRQYEPLCSLWCKTDTARATISDRGPVDIRLTLSIPHNNTLISQQTKPLLRLIVYSVYYICCITIDYNETTFSYIHCCYYWLCLCSSQPGPGILRRKTKKVMKGARKKQPRNTWGPIWRTIWTIIITKISQILSAQCLIFILHPLCYWFHRKGKSK